MRTITTLSLVLWLAAGCVVKPASPPPPRNDPPPTASPSAPPPSEPARPAPPPPTSPTPPPPPLAQAPAPPAPPPGTPPGHGGVPPGHGGVPPGQVGKGDKWSDRQFDRASNWDKLGERWVEGRVDRDTIKVGKKDGAFVAIAVVVEHSAVEMFDMLVTFGDGSTWSPGHRLVFGQGTTSRVIDLPGEARFIRKVEFRYGNLPGGGKAQVELWGLDASRDAGDGKDGGKGKGKGKGKGHGKGRGHD